MSASVIHPRDRAGDHWICPACETFNWPRDFCWQCEEPRPARPLAEPEPEASAA